MNKPDLILKTEKYVEEATSKRDPILITAHDKALGQPLNLF